MDYGFGPKDTTDISMDSFLRFPGVDKNILIKISCAVLQMRNYGNSKDDLYLVQQEPGMMFQLKLYWERHQVFQLNETNSGYLVTMFAGNEYDEWGERLFRAAKDHANRFGRM